MRRTLPWVTAAIVLVALWPTLCMSSEDGPTSCRSAVLLPLPWGDSADTWGMVVAAGAALLTYVGLRRLLRQGPPGTSRTRLDPFAVIAAALALTMLVVYLVVIRQQDGAPALWVVGVLALAAAGAGYGAVVTTRHRRTALLLAGVTLLALGVLAILSIGLPILAAGALCLVAVTRQGSSTPTPTP